MSSHVHLLQPVILRCLVIRFKGMSEASMPHEDWEYLTRFVHESQDIFNLSLGIFNDEEPLEVGDYDWMFDFLWPRPSEAVLIVNFAHWFEDAEFQAGYDV